MRHTAIKSAAATLSMQQHTATLWTLTVLTSTVGMNQPPLLLPVFPRQRPLPHRKPLQQPHQQPEQSPPGPQQHSAMDIVGRLLPYSQRPDTGEPTGEHTSLLPPLNTLSKPPPWSALLNHNSTTSAPYHNHSHNSNPQQRGSTARTNR